MRTVAKDRTAEINDFVSKYLGKSKGWPTPDEKIIVLRTESHQRMPFEVTATDTLKHLSHRDMYQYFIRYSKKLKKEFWLEPSTAKSIAEHWLSLAPAVAYESIPIFKFKSDPGFCWNRATFDPTPGPTPTWDKFCSHLDNVKAFKQFTGSIFVPDSYNQQYLVLWGAAGSGKGCYLRAIANVFGSGAVNKQISPRKADKHYFADVVSARFVYFDDFDDMAAFSCGLFKMWTGGGMVTIDPKGKPAYQAHLQNKIVFTTNDVPELKDTDSDRRRGIICEVQKLEDPYPEFEQDLNRELPHFIHHCLASRTDKWQTAIEIEEKSFEKVLEIAQMETVNYGYFWKRNFRIFKDKKTLAYSVIDAFKQDDITSNKIISKYYKWLEDNYPAERVRTGDVRSVLHLEKRESKCLQMDIAESEFYPDVIKEMFNNVTDIKNSNKHLSVAKKPAKTSELTDMTDK